MRTFILDEFETAPGQRNMSKDTGRMVSNELTTRMLSMLVEISAYPLMVVDDHFHISLINDDARRLLGIEEHFPRKGLNEFLPETSAEHLAESFFRLTEEEIATVTGTIEIDVTGLQYNIEVAPIRILGHGEEPSIVFLLIIKTGSTDSWETHRIKMATVGEFAAGIAHELNTPLANISLITENLMEEIDGPEQLEELQKILNQVEFSAHIVREILAFSRKDSPTFEIIDMNEVVERTVDTMVADEGYQINVDGSEAPAKVKGDPYQLQEIILNFVENAKDAMPEGGEVSISIRNKNGWVETTIRDRGRGIPRENLKKIFQPFFTTKPHGKGVGLGLAICKRIITNHNGEIDVKSQIGRGSRAIVKLPAFKKRKG